VRAVVGALAAAALAACNKGSSSSQSGRTGPGLSASDPIELTAEELTAAYVESRASADARYLKRWMLVDGKVMAARRGGTMSGAFLEGAPGVGVLAGSTIDSGERKQFESLMVGARKKFLCFNSGVQYEAVQLSRCTLK
jgi:hypothetical protein